MRLLRWASLAVWIGSWRIMYLEVTRWHHLHPNLRFNDAPAANGTVPRPGLPLRAARAAAFLAPVVFLVTLFRPGARPARRWSR